MQLGSYEYVLMIIDHINDHINNHINDQPADNKNATTI